MISLGGRNFSGPYLVPLWSPPAGSGLYAVMVPDPLCGPYRPIHLGQSADFSDPDLLAGHADRRRWLQAAGTEWNLYVAVLEMPLSTPGERRSEILLMQKGHCNAEL